MSQPTGISRRLQQCIAHLQANDYEGALVNLFPALDKTAKKRRPQNGVGARIRAFIDEEEILICSLTVGRPVNSTIIANGCSIADAIYKFGRTSIAHEGELDPRLKFSNANFIEIGENQWHFPISYILAMTIVVILAPENATERIDGTLNIVVFGRKFQINDLWGKKLEVEALVFQGRDTEVGSMPE